MAEDEIIKHTKAVYETFHDQQKSWKHKLKEILVEILIIVFAVTISIWFHNWSESWKDRKKEKEFLTGLKTDLQSDLKEMKSDTAAYTNILNGTSYFREVGAGKILSNDSINRYSWVFFASVHKQSRTSRFEALKGSGKLDIIENKELLGKIISLYQEIYPNIEAGNKSFSDYNQNRIGAYLDSHAKLDTSNNIINWPEILHTTEFRMGLYRANVIYQNILSYEVGIKKCNEIINQVDEELK